MKIFNTIADLESASLKAGQLVRVKGVGLFSVESSGAGYTLANGNKAVIEDANIPDPSDVTSGTQPTAATMAYVPAGTGAVTTDVQSKLREAVSVKDFGAVGDGVTDDTVAIQYIIDSVIGTTGGSIFFPKGVYNVTGLVLRGQDNIKMYGVGYSSIMQNTATDGSHAIWYKGDDIDVRCYGMVLEDLTIIGNPASGSGIQVDTGGYYEYQGKEASLTAFNRLKVESHGTNGIEGGGGAAGLGNSLKITNCIIKNNGRTGVYIRNQSNMVSLRGNTITENVQDGVEMNQVASTNTIAENFIADNSRYGVYCFRCEEPLIHLNGFNRNLAGAVVLSGDPVGSVKFTEAALIQGNLFGDNGSGGTGREISVYASKGCNIKENYFYGTGQTLMIYISDYVQGLMIKGNHFKDLTTEIKVQLKTGAVDTYATFDDDVREDNFNQVTYYGKTPQTLIQSSNVLHQTRAAGTDANPMYKVFGNGRLQWGDGTNPIDCTLSRESGGTLGVDAILKLNNTLLLPYETSDATARTDAARIYAKNDGIYVRWNDGTIGTIITK